MVDEGFDCVKQKRCQAHDNKVYAAAWALSFFEISCVAAFVLTLGFMLLKRKSNVNNTLLDPRTNSGEEYQSYRSRGLSKWDEESTPKCAHIPKNFRYKRQMEMGLIIKLILMFIGLLSVLPRVKGEISQAEGGSKAIAGRIQAEAKVNVIEQNIEQERLWQIKNSSVVKMPLTELESVFRNSRANNERKL